MPYPIDSKYIHDGNMNFPMVCKYQIFDSLGDKTKSITVYFGPKYGPPTVF